MFNVTGVSTAAAVQKGNKMNEDINVNINIPSVITTASLYINYLFDWCIIAPP